MNQQQDIINKLSLHFDVTLKRGKKLKNHQIISLFKLRKKNNENITVIDYWGKLKVYDSPIDIIKDFCDYRILKYNERYEYLEDEDCLNHKIVRDKIKFIQMVIDGRLDFKNKNRQAIKKDLTLHFGDSIIEILIKMPIYSLCQDEKDKLVKEAEDLHNRIQKYRKINTTKEFINELRKL